MFLGVIDIPFCLNFISFPIAGLPTSYVTGGNGNINIHVSVTINAGTLADLKKQRSQIRNNSPDGMTTGLSPVSSVTSSPMPSVQRFTGDTDDVVGDPRPKRCCIIS
jgi:protein phosphatase 1 regulatory subunit 16A